MAARNEGSLTACSFLSLLFFFLLLLPRDEDGEKDESIFTIRVFSPVEHARISRITCFQ